MTSELTEIFRTFNMAEADMMVCRLEAAGLHPSLQNAQSTLGLGTAVATGGIRVFLPVTENAEGRRVLDLAPE